MLSNEYREAIVEVLDILDHTRKEDVDKISPKFIEFLRANASKTYKPQLDHSKKISDMRLMHKTRVILAIIYRKYWCDDNQRNEFDRILMENEINYQKKLREKYNPDTVFKNKKK
ncbi:MAG: hypothetical protein IKM97_04030 [Clostridia bacterium]|nr:hypothetical protein [Clostridia bacterium]